MYRLASCTDSHANISWCYSAIKMIQFELIMTWFFIFVDEMQWKETGYIEGNIGVGSISPFDVTHLIKST